MTILTIFFVLATLVLIVMNRKGATWAKPALIVCAIITIGLVVTRMFVVGTGNNVTKSISQDVSYQAAVGSFLGESLAQRHPQARVVILVSVLATSKSHKRMIRKLQGTLEKSKLHVEVQLVDEKGEMISRADFQNWNPPSDDHVYRGVNLQKFQRLLAAKIGKADLVIYTLETPSGLSVSALPLRGTGPGLVLMYPGPLNVTKALMETDLDTVVLVRNHAKAWNPKTRVPSKVEEAFTNRYLLIHSGNIETLSGQKTLFGHTTAP